jgi:hypothetical protein
MPPPADLAQDAEVAQGPHAFVHYAGRSRRRGDTLSRGLAQSGQHLEGGKKLLQLRRLIRIIADQSLKVDGLASLDFAGQLFNYQAEGFLAGGTSGHNFGG